MSIRLVLGRAGSGKTYRCLEQIRERLRQNAATGHRLLFLVPEQASFQMERALIETPDIPAYTRCEVLSFQRLAYRIFAEVGAGPKRGDQTIGALGRLMLIRRILRHERPVLQLLGRVADKPGLIKQIAAAIDELMREKVEPEKLADIAQATHDSDPLQSAKMADLSRLYRGYLDALEGDRLDPGQYLSMAAERAAGCPWLDGAEIWVDGFAGFTAQEYELLTTLARRAQSMEITMLADPDTPAVTMDKIPPWWFSLFSRTERTMVRLRGELKKAGLSLAEPIRLPAGNATRFARPELARLEKCLFSRRSTPARLPLSRGEEGGQDARPPTSGQRPVADQGGQDARPPLPAVTVLELPDRRCEVDAAVAEIERLRREASPPMRYRDIAVIVRDLAPYHDLLSAALRAHEIPCFIDRRQPTTQHPLIELVRGLLAIASDDCQLESVRLLLKTGLLPITPEDADLLENYLLACGINGRSAWDEPWKFTRYFRRRDNQPELTRPQAEILEHINSIRRNWLDTLGPWLNAAVGNRQASGREWAEALFNCLDRLKVGPRLYEWADAAEENGQPDEAEAHRQVWADFVGLLDEFVRALGGESMCIREFQETTEAGLAEFSLGLAPATLDQVLIGAIERSRHPPVRAVLLLGFDDAHFPMRRGEDPLLGDDEREALAANEVEIGPPRRQQLLDERMLAYIALTRASERILITYPRAESDGKPVNASPYLRDVLAALPGLEPEVMQDPRGGRDDAWLTRCGELGARLAREFRYRGPISDEKDPAGRARWNALYEAVRDQRDWHVSLGRSLAGLKYANTARLHDGLVAQWIGQRFAASVSRLELFAACPFAHYLEYFLRLEQRIEADMRDVDLGTLCHAILEKFIKDLTDASRRLADLEDDEIGEGVESAAGEVAPRMADDLLLSEARNAFLLSRSRDHLRRVLRWQRDSARVGAYRPFRVEYPFGYAELDGGQLSLKTPKGREVVLRGRIDRVDIAELADEVLGVVIDYKHSTDRKLDFCKVFYGLSLQLVGYLLALQQAGRTPAGRPIRPVAAFYLPLLEPYQAVAHPSEEKKQSYRWRGIADCSALDTLDKTVEPGGSSEFMAARLTVKGEPYSNCDLARQDDFQALLAHTAERMAELADRLIDGDIAISPYRLRRQTPCSWCQYKPVCRYEIETQLPRALEALKKAEVFERMRRDEG